MILVFFLNRHDSALARWAVLIAFLLASPVALFLMIGSGLLGVSAFPQIPRGISMGLAGRDVGRGRMR